MFDKETYTKRRKALRNKVHKGIILLLGNSEISMNYAANTYRFRQDSSFLYFFGLNQANLIGLIDIDANKDYLFGDDVDLEEIIWTGKLPSLQERGETVGITHTAPLNKLNSFLQKAIKQGRRIHFLPVYRAENQLLLEKFLGIDKEHLKNYVSEELIRSIVDIRCIKEAAEIAEIEATIEKATYPMYIKAMEMAKNPDFYEYQISGAMEGIALANNGSLAFPTILSIDGQILHNHNHSHRLQAGRLLLVDAGAESANAYATDITRTFPVGGRFSEKQKAIYSIVLKAETESIKAIRPDVPYQEIHFLACRIISEGLKELGLMKGDIEQAVQQGASALFFPHGLGHHMGLDVHDMENLGEDFVGYDEEIKRSDLFGAAYLRMGRRLQTGFVITVEPGIYFIPELIHAWKSENKFSEFIDYQKLEEYLDFGGIRIEEDILVTETGSRILGKPIPKTIEEIETLMNS